MKKLFFPLMVLLIFTGGCGTATKVTATWKNDPEMTYEFKKIGIIGITPNATGRKIAEQYIEDGLTERGITSLGGFNFLPPNASEDNLPRDILRGFLEQEKFDAILTLSLIRSEDIRQHHRGSYYYIPDSDTYFGDYYGQMRNYLYAPGYTIESTTFFIESNLYSYPEGELLWSIQTTSSEVTDIHEGAESLAKAIVSQLFKDKVVAESN